MLGVIETTEGRARTNKRMRVAWFEKFGGSEVVSVKEIPFPNVKAGDLKVKVYATSVNSGDDRIRAARFPAGLGTMARLFMFGVFKPRINVLGIFFSGVVTEVGSEVEDFSVGDEVCGSMGIKMGAHSEYVVISAKGSIVKKPESVSHVDAAGSFFGGTTALFALEKLGEIKPGQKILVVGASGSVGEAAVQLGKAKGAIVTGVCSSKNEEMVMGLGADSVICYDKTPLETVTEKYDLVIDAVGGFREKYQDRHLLPHGLLIMLVADMGEMIKSPKYAKTGVAPDGTKELDSVLSFVSSGLFKPVISHVLSLDQVQEAHKIVESGRKIGNVVVLPHKEK